MKTRISEQEINFNMFPHIGETGDFKERPKIEKSDIDVNLIGWYNHESNENEYDIIVTNKKHGYKIYIGLSDEIINSLTNKYYILQILKLRKTKRYKDDIYKHYSFFDKIIMWMIDFRLKHMEIHK